MSAVYQVYPAKQTSQRRRYQHGDCHVGETYYRHVQQHYGKREEVNKRQPNPVREAAFACQRIADNDCQNELIG